MTTTKDHKRGPKPERVKIEGDWEDAIDTALEKERPKEGWPKDESSSAYEKDEDSHPDTDSEQVDPD